MVCSGRIASDPDPDRATLVVHARAETLGGVPDAPNAEIEGGPVIAPQTAQRLACDARLQVVAEDAHANPLRLGRLTRTPSAQMLRSLRYRDRHRRFPGCARRRFTNAHHIVFWSRGGRTDLDNLVLVCGSITAWCTKAGGGSASIPMRPCAGSVRVGCATGRGRRRREVEHVAGSDLTTP